MLTIKGLLTGLTVLVLSLIAVLTQTWILLLLELPLLYPLLLSMAFPLLRVDGVKVRREVSRKRVVEGDTVTVTLLIKNDSGRLLFLRILEEIEPPLEVIDGSLRGFFVLKQGEEGKLSYKVSAKRRGHFNLGPTRVEAYDPFLLRREEIFALEPDEIAVLPRILRKYRIAVTSRFTMPRPGEIASKQAGDGGDFLEVREAQEYILRRVNWKATARTRHWMINAFEGERLTSILVILDVSGKRLLGEVIDDFIDELVRVAASIVYSFISAGNNVALLVVGNYRDWIRPGAGKKQLFRLLTSLADVRYLSTKQIIEYEEVFKRISLLISPLGSSVVIISPFAEKEIYDTVSFAESMGYPVTCVAVNPFSIRWTRDQQLHQLLTESWKKGVLKLLSDRRRKLVLVEST
ncbi:DUF58 domain-containing protein [Infirmifilum uzonense]|uniref:DUF58 domain-containing protein n=1 Tax=Infirmifilum uzonense TaxID=1550241 RepID=UPI003C783B11